MLEQGARGGFVDGSNDSSARAINTSDDCLRRAREGDGSAFTELVSDFHVPTICFNVE